MTRLESVVMSLINHEESVVEVQLACWSSTKHVSCSGTSCKWYE